MTAAKIEAFLQSWAAKHVRLVRPENRNEAKRLVRACFVDGYRQGIAGQELIEACARLCDGGRLREFMQKRLDFLFLNYREATIMPKSPKGEKRPADVIGNAVKVMRIATGDDDGGGGNSKSKRDKQGDKPRASAEQRTLAKPPAGAK